MPSYETLCIFHPELPETRIKELGAWMQKIVEGVDGTAVQIDAWGIRDLAHLIRKQRRGYYLRLVYNASGAAVKELERNLGINESVLRFLSTVRKPEVVAPVAPSTPVATPAAPQENSPVEQ